MLRSILASLLLVSSLAVVGCKSGGMSSSDSLMTTMPPPQHAVLVSGGNGESTVVFIPSSDPNKPAIYASTGSTPHMCAQCQADIAKYFSTGQVMATKCPVCGATRTPLSLTAPTNVGHQ